MQGHIEASRPGFGAFPHVVHGGLTISAGMPQGRNARSGGNRLLEEGKTFRQQFGPEERQASDVASRPCKARDEPLPHRIAHHRHDHWNCTRGLLHGVRHKRVGRDDQVNLQVHQLIRERSKPFNFALGLPVLENDVRPLHITEFSETLPEGLDHSRYRRTSAEPADARQLLGRLRAHSERNQNGPARKHELPPPCMSGKEHSEV